MLKVYCEIYKSASSFYVNNPEFKFTIEYFLEKIKKISGKLNYLIVDSTTLNNVQIFINHLSNKNIQILNDKYFELFECLIKKISKGVVAMDEKQLMNKINGEAFDQQLANKSEKIINMVF